ncbi:MAG: HAD family hydrolase [Planctomycetota bacterium]|jgi:beta-phosphoglucomutase
MTAFKIPEGLTAIMLDMDGVVIDGMPYHMQAWREAFATVGMEVTDVDIYLKEGMDQMETVLQLSREKGVSLSHDDMKRVVGIKNRILNSIFEIRLFPHCPEFLSRLKALGYKLALVTGTNQDVVEKILDEETALRGVFDVVVTAATASRRKPDPEPYLKAVELLGVDKKHCLVIENSPAGVASAKKAGLVCLALTTSLPEKYLGQADGIFHGLDEVSELFD